MNYYRQYPGMIDTIARRVGYRVRPSFVWHYEGGDRSGLVIGFANDGIAGVPGVLRVNVTTDDGTVPSWRRTGSRLSAAREDPAGTVRTATANGLEGLKLRRRSK